MMSWERVGKHGTADPELNWHKPAGVGTNVWSAMPVIGAHRISREVVSCQSLRSRGARSAELAPHLLLAAAPGDAEAVRELRHAAAEASTLGAHDSAARYLRQ